jgi:histone H3/H4
MKIARPSIIRLARRAGIKSVSEECIPLIRALIYTRLDYIIQNALIINSEHGTKTLMTDDVYDALSFTNENLTQSNELGTSTITK